MDSTTAAYERLIARFTAWARSDDNLRAAFVIGSRARTDHPADEWSDLDVVMLADDPMPYIDTTEWLHHIGTPWLTFIEPTPVDDGFERRILFEGGLDVDFAPSPVAEFRQMVRDGLPAYLVDMLRRGIRVLVDKDGDAAGLFVPNARPVPTPPAESEFLNLVNDFWYHTVYTAKHLRRGNSGGPKGVATATSSNCSWRTLEWHTQARHGDEIDTWSEDASWRSGPIRALWRHYRPPSRVTTPKRSGRRCSRRWSCMAGWPARRLKSWVMSTPRTAKGTPRPW